MRNNVLENRLPPPLVLLICVALVWVGYRTFGKETAGLWETGPWGVPYIIFGVAVILLGVIQFRIEKTTVNPLDPEQASALVSGGVFSYTRNPMYLGMALILLGQIVSLGWPPGLIVLLAFIFYIQIFQIRPEERAMRALFGETFSHYCNQVRRWI